MMMCDSLLYVMNVLLPLVNKEAALAYGRAEYSKQKIQEETEEERRQKQANANQSPRKQDM